jgi:hypothetical protein
MTRSAIDSILDRKAVALAEAIRRFDDRADQLARLLRSLERAALMGGKMR